MLVAKSGPKTVQTQLTLVAIHVSGEPPKSEGILIQWRCYFAPLVWFFVFYQTILFSKGIVRHVRGILHSIIQGNYAESLLKRTHVSGEAVKKMHTQFSLVAIHFSGNLGWKSYIFTLVARQLSE